MSVGKRSLPHRSVDQDVAVDLDRQPDRSRERVRPLGPADPRRGDTLLTLGERRPAPAATDEHGGEHSQRGDEAERPAGLHRRYLAASAAVKMSVICHRVVIWRAATALAVLAATMLAMSGSAYAAPGVDTGLPAIPPTSRQLIVVTAPRASATLGTLTAETRSAPGARWRRVRGPWPAELGRRGLSAHRHEGDGTTPVGIFAIAPILYGNAPPPAGLRERYRRLGCGDWWDEDPASARYNRFVVVPCGVTPGFAAGSEALWTETVAYPFLAVIEFNAHPIRRGRGAPGSGIFLHNWTGTPTAGCVAVHRSRLLSLLRWLAPSRHPVIAISVAGARVA